MNPIIPQLTSIDIRPYPYIPQRFEIRRPSTRASTKAQRPRNIRFQQNGRGSVCDIQLDEIKRKITHMLSAGRRRATPKTNLQQSMHQQATTGHCKLQKENSNKLLILGTNALRILPKKPQTAQNTHRNNNTDDRVMRIPMPTLISREGNFIFSPTINKMAIHSHEVQQPFLKKSVHKIRIERANELNRGYISLNGKMDDLYNFSPVKMRSLLTSTHKDRNGSTVSIDTRILKQLNSNLRY